MDALAEGLKRRALYRAALTVYTTALGLSDTANRRAATLRHLERLAAAVASVGEPLWYAESTNEAETIPPEIEEPLHDYVDLASARLAGFCPLTLPPPTGDCQPAASADAGDTAPFGILVVEQFDRLAPEELRERLPEIEAALIAAWNAIPIKESET